MNRRRVRFLLVAAACAIGLFVLKQLKKDPTLPSPTTVSQLPLQDGDIAENEMQTASLALEPVSRQTDLPPAPFPENDGGLDVPQQQVIEPEKRNITIAIATTILSPGPAFSIWLNYHLRIVDLIIIFMDDPLRQPIFENLVRGKPVVLFNGSTTANDLSVESRLILRQDANNEAAITYALAQNITWLMHIDTDEIFYEEGDHSWTARENVGVISFTNHESVPLPYTPVNPFAECTLFKISGGEMGFMAYGNGKSAVRLTPGVHSNGPHGFWGYQGEEWTLSKPMILHYPTPSYEKWVEKYTQYGNFSNYWYNDPQHPNELGFMLRSRDYVQAALRTGNWDDARRFFDLQIPDAETTERFLASGTLRRITPLRNAD